MEAVRLLTSRVLSNHTLDALECIPQLHRYEYTGCGYFAILRHPDIPTERVVCHSRIVVGESHGVHSGFVVFLEGNELTLECHSWGDDAFPANYREQDVRISNGPNNPLEPTPTDGAAQRRR